ncbi:hypothetical protein BH09ACT1_BH09ACT1_27110 [soil metagenome]
MQSDISQLKSTTDRVLFVHAHPDDETITTGGTIATLLDRGAEVTVLTCTRGERGEVIPPELHDLEGDFTALARHRTDELAAAMAALGVTDHRMLGEPGARLTGIEPRRYTDSGMRWGEAGAEALEQTDDGSLTSAPFGEVAADIASVIEAIRPTAVVSYDSNGGYGHPDHVRAAEAAKRAAEVMGVPFFEVDAEPSATSDLSVDVTAALPRKTAALRAHRTQVTVGDGTFALSSGPARPIAAVESFSRVHHGVPMPEPVAWKDQGLGLHVFAAIVAGVLGLALGAIVTVNHQFTLSVLTIALPLGIIVSLLLVAALILGLRLVFGGRLIAFVAALGVVVSIAVLSLSGGGGSVLVPANAAGYLLTYGPVVIAVLLLGWPSSVRIVNGKIVVKPDPKGTSSL